MLGIGRSSEAEDASGSKEIATRLIDRCGFGRGRFLRLGVGRSFLFPIETYRYGRLAAGADAVIAIDAAAHVDGVRGGINTFRLAIAGAKATTIALVGINGRCKSRLAAEETEPGAYRTQRVAP